MGPGGSFPDIDLYIWLNPHVPPIITFENQGIGTPKLPLPGRVQGYFETRESGSSTEDTWDPSGDNHPSTRNTWTVRHSSIVGALGHPSTTNSDCRSWLRTTGTHSGPPVATLKDREETRTECREVSPPMVSSTSFIFSQFLDARSLVSGVRPGSRRQLKREAFCDEYLHI